MSGGEEEDARPYPSTERRILKVRLRQDQVIRLHELRILEGKSIAALLEGILEEYLSRDHRFAKSHASNRASTPPTADPPAGAT